MKGTDTCKNCKYWGDAAEDWEDDSAGLHTCRAIRPRWVIADEVSDRTGLDKYDNTDEWLRARREAVAAEKAVVVDGSQYHAEFLTTADFFCARFSPSPPKD